MPQNVIGRVRENPAMPVQFRPVVIAICGSPGAGKTTVASAAAEHLGLMLVARDDIKTGLGWSSAVPSDHGGLAFADEYHVAGGAFSQHAEQILTDTTLRMASARTSLIVENSVLSPRLVDDVQARGARVLAVHVVADPAVIGQRLERRLPDGGPVAQQLASQHQRGAMDLAIFEPPANADATVRLDTSNDCAPDVRAIELAATDLAVREAADDASPTGGDAGAPGVGGVNHVTIATSDLERSLAFYTDILGCRLLARWPRGAYLLAGDLWVALVQGMDETRHPDDYSHIAFDATPAQLAQVTARADAAGVGRWQDNWTEGDSIYLHDPSGRRIEVHSTSLLDRLIHATQQPWDRLVIESDAIAAVRHLE